MVWVIPERQHESDPSRNSVCPDKNVPLSPVALIIIFFWLTSSATLKLSAHMENLSTSFKVRRHICCVMWLGKRWRWQQMWKHVPRFKTPTGCKWYWSVCAWYTAYTPIFYQSPKITAAVSFPNETHTLTHWCNLSPIFTFFFYIIIRARPIYPFVNIIGPDIGLAKLYLHLSAGRYERN